MEARRRLADEGAVVVIADRLDAYESYPEFYNRIKVPTSTGLIVWVYVIQGETDARWRVKDGDWRGYRNRPRPEAMAV